MLELIFLFLWVCSGVGVSKLYGNDDPWISGAIAFSWPIVLLHVAFFGEE